MSQTDHSQRTPFPTRAWIHGAVAMIVLGLVVLALGRLGHSSRVDQPTDFDRLVHAWVVAQRPQWPVLTVIFRWATRFGNPDVATLATAFVVLGLYAMHRRGVAGISKSEAFFWLGVILGGRYLSIFLKELYQRERPEMVHRLVAESTYSFPSGHSVFAAIYFTMLGALLARLVPSTRPYLRAVLVGLCLLAAGLIGASRIWLGVHYPTDVAGGLILGAAWALLVLVARLGWRHWMRHRTRDA